MPKSSLVLGLMSGTSADSNAANGAHRSTQQEVLFTPLDRAALEKHRAADLDNLAPWKP
jgi:hypothetical protein